MIEDTHISLAHGNGGRHMRALIEHLFARHLGGPDLDVGLDAAPIALPAGQELLITTDGFIVQPLRFAGGDIGTLAVNGTVNDLAVSGATARYLTLNAFIEEGFEVSELDRLIGSLAAAARAAQVCVVAGDTKVLPRGQGGGLYLATTGVGFRPAGVRLGMGRIAPGDEVLVSGPVGDHAIAVMLARGAFELSGDVCSDCAPVGALALPLAQMDGVRFMRDPTRGGLATVAHEIANATGLDVHLDEAAIPVRPAVRAVCDILGYDPYSLACEGRVVAVVAPSMAAACLALWRGLPQGAQAARIGTLASGVGEVILHTGLGGERCLDELDDDPLPRIC